MSEEYRELLIGCGHSREKLMHVSGRLPEWSNLTTLDQYPECDPTYLCNLNVTPWRIREMGTNFESTYFANDYFDEIHAYEVLEHLGRQGDAESFFNTFNEIYRILKPGGHLMATCPSRTSAWLWGDPSHTRAIQTESLAFLDQGIIHNNRKRNTAMSDFSLYWKGDLQKCFSQDNGANHIFMLKAHKPARVFDMVEMGQPHFTAHNQLKDSGK
jgi:SAM-dependent methyltransferase